MESSGFCKYVPHIGLISVYGLEREKMILLEGEITAGVAKSRPKMNGVVGNNTMVNAAM